MHGERERDMDWWKLFSGTFVLIFLAELGDKTQLAALAKTADAPDGSMAKWVVFFGASAALVLSTFIAVFLGHVLRAVVPDERYIKAAAAVLFLVFGISILVEVAGSFFGEKKVASVSEKRGMEEVGVVGGMVLSAAMDLEKGVGERYRKLAESAEGDLAAVLRELAREEDSHLRHLREFRGEERGDNVWKSDGSIVESVGKAVDGVAVGLLVEHEEATAAFYRGLAERALLPSVRRILLHLAEEEESHARRLREFV